MASRRRRRKPASASRSIRASTTASIGRLSVRSPREARDSESPAERAVVVPSHSVDSEVMQNHTLGTLNTSALGLGCMAMSGAYGHADRAESVATVRTALDAGITLLDTGDFYGMGHNEL